MGKSGTPYYRCCNVGIRKVDPLGQLWHNPVFRSRDLLDLSAVLRLGDARLSPTVMPA